MSIRTWAPIAVLAVLAASVAACAFGATSRLVYVIGLGPILMGLVAGGAAAIGSLYSLGRIAKGTLPAALLAFFTAWCGVQGFDDLHFRQAFRDDLVQARLAASGLPADSPIEETEKSFYASDADQTLSKEVKRQVGFSGPFARWVFRADSGIRLFGPWRQGRGLAVGRWGCLIWAFCELLIGSLVARSVIRKVAATPLETADGRNDV